MYFKFFGTLSPGALRRFVVWIILLHPRLHGVVSSSILESSALFDAWSPPSL